MDNNKIVVLFSGGWESTYCLLEAVNKYSKENVHAVYLDYGQPYTEERIAAREICEFLDVDFKITLTADLYTDGSKIFNGRNLMFFSTLTGWDEPATIVYFGSRGLFQFLDAYGDSNWSFGKTMGRALHMKVKMPCTCLPKATVKRKVLKQGIPADLIFSTEDL